MNKIQMNFLIEKKDLKLIKKIAEKRGQNSGDFTRYALKKELARLGFLSKYDAKALGIIKK